MAQSTIANRVVVFTLPKKKLFFSKGNFKENIIMTADPIWIVDGKENLNGAAKIMMLIEFRHSFVVHYGL